MEYIFKGEADYDRFVEHLKSKKKTESVNDSAKHKAIINTKHEIICLAMKEIRNIANQIAKTDFKGFLEYARDDTYEEILIQGLVIAQIKDIPLQMKYFDVWKEKIDCWAHCDSVISSMKCIGKNKQRYFDYFYRLCFEEKEFVARLGIIAMMDYYLVDEYIDKIFEMCRSISNDAYYVKMGIAWLISFAFIKCKGKTYDFLAEKHLDKFTQNKAISKCRESYRVSAEDKQKLIELRM